MSDLILKRLDNPNVEPKDFLTTNISLTKNTINLWGYSFTGDIDAQIFICEFCDNNSCESINTIKQFCPIAPKFYKNSTLKIFTCKLPILTSREQNCNKPSLIAIKLPNLTTKEITKIGKIWSQKKKIYELANQIMYDFFNYTAIKEDNCNDNYSLTKNDLKSFLISNNPLLSVEIFSKTMIPLSDEEENKLLEQLIIQQKRDSTLLHDSLALYHSKKGIYKHILKINTAKTKENLLASIYIEHGELFKSKEKTKTKTKLSLAAETSWKEKATTITAKMKSIAKDVRTRASKPGAIYRLFKKVKTPPIWLTIKSAYNIYKLDSLTIDQVDKFYNELETKWFSKLNQEDFQKFITMKDVDRLAISSVLNLFDTRENILANIKSALQWEVLSAQVYHDYGKDNGWTDKYEMYHYLEHISPAKDSLYDLLRNNLSLVVDTVDFTDLEKLGITKDYITKKLEFGLLSTISTKLQGSTIPSDESTMGWGAWVWQKAQQVTEGIMKTIAQQVGVNTTHTVDSRSQIIQTMLEKDDSEWTSATMDELKKEISALEFVYRAQDDSTKEGYEQYKKTLQLVNTKLESLKGSDLAETDTTFKNKLENTQELLKSIIKQSTIKNLNDFNRKFKTTIPNLDNIDDNSAGHIIQYLEARDQYIKQQDPALSSEDAAKNPLSREERLEVFWLAKGKQSCNSPLHISYHNYTKYLQHIEHANIFMYYGYSGLSLRIWAKIIKAIFLSYQDNNDKKCAATKYFANKFAKSIQNLTIQNNLLKALLSG